ncbi:MAG: DUF4197 domain-containing protein [Rhodospirillales bacterium]|nr:DUF4197 domain-containing protein [Rhodospirillales bacterium]MCB9996886.1 DUF4197 domain-containing protein [Rhodospirillales bacterium]
MTAALCLCFTAADAQAQDWWQKAKSVMQSDTGSKVMKTIEQTTGQNSATVTNAAQSELNAGLREALRVGAEKVVGQLGKPDGFNADPSIHIPLPGTLARVDAALSSVGMGGMTDDLELKLNRAAEAATPKARELFINAISQMTIDDAKAIMNGPQDAATQYLRRTMGPELGQEMTPLVQQALASAGAVQAYDNVMGQYGQIPFMPDVKANLNDYVVGKAMDGIFHYIGQEEAAIRTNPAARTTDLLQKVFAGQ